MDIIIKIIDLKNEIFLDKLKRLLYLLILGTKKIIKNKLHNIIFIYSNGKDYY
jgi:hypothetical protein